MRRFFRRYSDAGPAAAQFTFVLGRLGRRAEAAAMYAKTRQYFPEGADPVQDCWLLEELIVQKGKPAAARLVSKWEAEAKKRYVDPYNLAAMRFSIGDKEGTFRLLRKAHDERSPSLAMIKVEPFFQPIWDRPAYQDLLRAMNLLR